MRRWRRYRSRSDGSWIWPEAGSRSSAGERCRGKTDSLCHLPTEAAEDVAVYRKVLTRFAARTGIPAEPVPGAPSNRRARSPLEVLSRLHAQLCPEEARVLDGRRLALLSDEERYALYKLADPARDPARLRVALLELGFSEGAPHTVRCGRPIPTPR